MPYYTSYYTTRSPWWEDFRLSVPQGAPAKAKLKPRKSAAVPGSPKVGFKNSWSWSVLSSRNLKLCCWDPPKP